jgi:hypothetical protein
MEGRSGLVPIGRFGSVERPAAAAFLDFAIHGEEEARDGAGRAGAVGGVGGEVDEPESRAGAAVGRDKLDANDFSVGLAREGGEMGAGFLQGGVDGEQGEAGDGGGAFRRWRRGGIRGEEGGAGAKSKAGAEGEEAGPGEGREGAFKTRTEGHGGAGGEAAVRGGKQDREGAR